MRFAAALALLMTGLLPAAEIPRPATGLQWKTSDGQTVDISKYKGKVVCAEILSTTCPHCQETAGMLSRLTAEFPAKDLQIVGVAINDDANVQDFISRFNVKFPVGKGNRDQALGFMQHSLMRSFYFPGLVFIDRNGMIQAQYMGNDAFVQTGQEANIRAQLKKMLPPAAGAKSSSSPTKSGKRKAS